MSADTRSRAALLAELARFRGGPGGGRLSDLCRQIAERLDLRAVALQLTDGRQFQWQAGESGSAGGVGGVGGMSRGTRRPVIYGGDQVGVLGVDAGAIGGLGSHRRRVLEDVVDLLGPVLEVARRQHELEATQARARDHAERIAVTRREAFAERDRERRELERDLHDGAQHHLVALRMGVALLELQLAAGDPEVIRDGLAKLSAGLEQAEQTLLNTAAGVCPPMLVDQGLVEALNAEFSDLAGEVRVLADGLDKGLSKGRRFPLAVETAVYFTCLEAVNNARKHAPGARISVRLSDDSQRLWFSVTDDGPGLDRQDPLDSFGLGNMRSRIVSAGGELELRSAAGAGTTVAGFIPL